MRPRTFGARWRQRGVTLIEVALALVILGAMAAYGMKRDRDYREAQVDRAGGEHLKLVQLGLQRYLDDNAAALLAGAAVPGVLAPMQPTMAELRALNVMGASVGDIGPTRLTYTLRVDRLPAACVPGVNCIDLQGVAWSSVWLAPDGNPQRDRLGAMALAMGVDAAVPNLANGAQIVGQDGIWPIANPVAGNPQGIIVARAGFGSSINLNALLPRDGSRPMVGNLDMNGNSINNVATVNSNTIVNTGTVTTATLAAATVNATTLTNTTTNTAGTTTSGTLNVTGAATIGGALTGTTGTFTGGLQSATLTTTGSATIGGAVQATGNLATAGALQLDTAVVESTACAANLVSRTAANILVTCQAGVWRRVGSIGANEGDACATEGTTAIAADDGSQLVCRGGRFIKIPALLPTLIASTSQVVVHGTALNKPNCGAFGTAFLTPAPVAFATSDGALNVVVTDIGAQWVITLVDGTGFPAGVSPQAIVVTGCRI